MYDALRETMIETNTLVISFWNVNDNAAIAIIIAIVETKERGGKEGTKCVESRSRLLDSSSTPSLTIRIFDYSMSGWLGTICKGLDGRRRKRRALQYLQDVCIYIILRVPFRGGSSAAAAAASIMSSTRGAGVLFGAAAADSSLTRHYWVSSRMSSVEVEPPFFPLSSAFSSTCLHFTTFFFIFCFLKQEEKNKDRFFLF